MDSLAYTIYNAIQCRLSCLYLQKPHTLSGSVNGHGIYVGNWIIDLYFADERDKLGVNFVIAATFHGRLKLAEMNI